MSFLFDAGDMQRLEREQTLTEQAPRQLPVEDRSPDENNHELAAMLDGLTLALQKRRLQ